MTLVFGAALVAVGVVGAIVRRDTAGLVVACETIVAGALVTAAGATRPALAVVAAAAAVAHVAVLRRLTRATDDAAAEPGDSLRW